ncbi:hypothetical protein JCM11491_003265 [Sporobolomyces phaffii]
MGPDHSYQAHRARYAAAITHAEQTLERLVESDPASWRPVTASSPPPPPASSSSLVSSSSTSSSASTVSLAAIPHVDPSRVRLDRRAATTTTPDVLRATVDLDLVGPDASPRAVLDSLRVAATTPETRPVWDKLVEHAHTLELVDPKTKVVKTDYRLGWPASPRDTVTISRTVTSPSYVIDCATSLPRFADEPSFLRPAPPYVRSHVSLYAWVFEVLPPAAPESSSESPGTRRAPRVRIRLFWSWSLHHRGPPPPTTTIPATFLNPSSTMMSSSSSSTHPYLSHMPHLVASLVSYVRATSCSSSTSSTSPSVPSLETWSQARGVEMVRAAWDATASKWHAEWDVVSVPVPPPSAPPAPAAAAAGGDVLVAKNKNKRKRRPFVTVRMPVPAGGEGGGGGRDGWDVRIARVSSPSPSSPGVGGDAVVNDDKKKKKGKEEGEEEEEEDDEEGFRVELVKRVSPGSGAVVVERFTLRVVHGRGVRDDDLAGLERYKLTITRLVGGKGIRINGGPLVTPATTTDLDDDDDEDRDGDGDGDGEERKGREDEVAKWERALNRASSAGPLVVAAPATAVSSSSSSSIVDSSAISLRSTHSGATMTTASASAAAAASEISTLLRRSYIYFLSLLQEPAAKWRPITDSSQGVTVTQLLSPDPTLTIYRAEAVFVGVGVWDVFASVVGGAKPSWDKQLDETRLVRGRRDGDGHSELSEVWWEKRKGTWPVAPRDSVTLRTAYKSPASVHIFSFSTDDAALFPDLPEVEPGTIRTHTDLSGWAIEALSPTTTSITLLDQSDPKGWSNKSWTPSHLVQQVAGVRDFTLRNGAPPVVTRLAGARKRQVGYEHDKGTFRVEYEPSSTTGTVDPIELELRCDVSVWSPQGLELMIDPPPSSVSCLSRHRLSAGGGMWLTIEHPPLVVESQGGKVVVTVRRASKTAGGGDKGATPTTTGGGGGVTINGARVKVDVEVLEDDKVKELEGRKRRKFSPVPLDQYETLGARVWANNPASGGAGDPKKASTATSGGGDGSTKGAAAAAGEASTSSLSETLAGAAATSIVAAGSASADPANPSSSDSVGSASGPSSSTPPGGTAAESTSRRPSPRVLEPAAAALEALAYLQSFHAEQGPELTDPAPGWSIVSDRGGTVVRKKLIARVSDVIPVYRGDRVVQGLTADEMASVVTSAGCRHVWDERVDHAVTLASYGHGVSTAAISTKPAFPFKGRIFHVATVVASVKVPSASSTASTSTVRFVASASYTPSSSSPSSSELEFDPAKVNPTALLPGQVLLEGWILETLDPYTSSVLAIPSTRCTYLAAIDQKGSVPLALNQVLNANLARSISNVEAFGKTRGPIPRISTPSVGVQIEGPLSEDGDGDCVWKLSRATGGSAATVVASNYGDQENTFRGLFKVGRAATKHSPTSPDPDDGLAERPLSDKPTAAATTTTTTKSLASVGSTLLKSELPRSASLTFGTAAPPVLHKSSVTSDLSHKRSRGSLRSKSPAAPPVATTTTGGVPLPVVAAAAAAAVTPPSSSNSLTTTTTTTMSDTNAHDLVVAELIVDLKQYPHGYSVAADSVVLDDADELPSLDPLAPRAATGGGGLPLRLTAHDAPLPSILTASLDAWKRANHLVRVLVPTSHITHPLEDPLRDPSHTRVEKPEWYRQLVDGPGALVEIKIVPLPAPTTTPTTPTTTERLAKQPPPASVGGASEPTGLGKVTGQANRTVVFNGEKVTVMSQKESRVVLARFEDEDAPLQGAKLSRVARRKRKTTASTAAGAKTTVGDSLESPRADTPSSSSLPLELQHPLAISTRLVARPAPSTPVDERDDDFDFPDPKSPGMTTPAHPDGGGSRSPVMSKSGSMQASATRRSTTSSDSTPLSGPLSAILGSYPLARLGSSLVNATTTATAAPLSGSDPTASSHGGGGGDGALGGLGSPRRRRVAVAHQRYSLGFVVAVALIAFLLGSFLRSLLTPADYIIYHAAPPPPPFGSSSSEPSSSGPAGVVARGVVEQALLTAFDPDRRWREARRLVELRTGGGPLGSLVGWDLIVAAVRRD